MRSKVLVLVSLFSCFLSVSCSEFVVGGNEGWSVPKSKEDEQFYNDWAAKNRFKVNDTVRFKYKKDSVMVVSEEEEYSKCRSSHPFFFSNNGDTSFRLERPGLFYFISGVTGHCERGQKMIIKVLEIETPPLPPLPPQSSQDHTSSSSSNTINAAAKIAQLPLLLGLLRFL